MPFSDEHKAAQAAKNSYLSDVLTAAPVAEPLYAYGEMTVEIGDYLTFDGVYPPLPWWQRALVALRLMQEPERPLSEFRVMERYSIQPTPEDWRPPAITNRARG